MSENKILLLDGMGNGSSAVSDGLLSMIPGLFTNLMNNNKMDPNLVAALMNGKNNQESFGGQGSWWIWIFLLFWIFGGQGFGNMFGRNGGLPNQLNGDAGRELLMQAIQGNHSAIEQIASSLNCTTTQLNSALCALQGSIDKVAGQIGMSTQSVINAIQSQGCEIGNKISSCCCNLTNLITQQGYENRISNLEQTNSIQRSIEGGFRDNNDSRVNMYNALSAKIDAQTKMITDQFCDLEKRTMQKEIDKLREEKQTLQLFAAQQTQTQNIVNKLSPCPIPAYLVCNPNNTPNQGCCGGGANV